MIKRATVTISKSIGSVSVLETKPKSYKAVIVLAHGAGAGMEHIFMEQLSAGLAEKGIASVRYNFPFKEHGKGRPDVAAVAEKTVTMVSEWTFNRFRDVPVFLGGKSFGGRMSSQWVAKACPEFIQGIVFYGFPLHGIGKESTDRADHLKLVKNPMLFLQGTRDKLATIELIRKVCRKLPTATLVELEGADHSFKVAKKLTPHDLPACTDSWLMTIL